MRIAYIGHSYHRKTHSNAFFTDILCSMGAVDFFWDESWNCGDAINPEAVLTCGYDLIVVWQTEDIVAALANRHPGVVFAPMYDGVRHRDERYWRSIAGARILAFCLEVHATALRYGLASRYFRYYPEIPESVPDRFRAGLKGFFWQRNKEVDWGTVRRLISGTPFAAFTLHDAPDPGKPFRPAAPTGAERHRYGIRRTTWFPAKRAMESEAGDADVYFAPRAAEGIGMSFLEAMARGQLVVAPDRPTMNEYIRHGVNGLLYDPDRPGTLDFSKAKAMAREARVLALRGRARWLASVPELVAFLQEPPVFATDSVSGPVLSGNPPTSSLSPMPVPRVSFIIPSYNQARFIGRTLDSILAQGLALEECEVLVFDGGSRDGTVSILQTHALKPRWISEKDGGQADAINRGLSVARGEIMAWINSDDVYEPDAIRRVIEVFECNPDVEVIYGRARLIDDDDSPLGEYPVLPWSYDVLTDSCFLCQPAVFFRRSVVEKYGPLDESLHYAMDYEYWLRIGKHTPFKFIDATLAASRIYAETKTLRDKRGVFREGLEVSRRHTGRPSRAWLRGYGYWRAKAWCDRRGIKSPVPVALAVFVSRRSLWFEI